ncbi:putative ATP-binding protein [Vibrio cholerae HC-55A1]|nr:putative ATP-binding protein [Vibrio cholerae HC-55A1]
MAEQTTHAQPAVGRSNQQRQVDDRREIPPHPPGQLRRRPGAHSGTGRADAIRTVGNPLLRRATCRDGRAIAPAPTAAGNGAIGAGTATQGRRAHAGDRRIAQRPGRQQRQPPGIPQPAAFPRQRAAHPAGRGRHTRCLLGDPLGRPVGKPLRADDAAGVGGQRRLLLTAGQLRGFAPAAATLVDCHAGYGPLPAHAQRGHHRRAGAPVDGGGRRCRGER